MKDCDVHALHTSLGQGVLVFRKLSSQPCRHNQLTAHWEVRIKDGLTCKRKGLKECTGGPGASACSQQDAPASAAKALGPRALAAGIAFHSTSSSNVPAVVFPSWAMNFTLRMILKSWDTCVQSSCKKSGPSPITQCIARRLDVPLRALMQFVSREASPSLLSPFWCGHVLCLSRADGGCAPTGESYTAQGRQLHPISQSSAAGPAPSSSLSSPACSTPQGNLSSETH